MENSIRISIKLLFYSLFLSLFIGYFAFAESGGVSSKKVSFTPEMCRYGEGGFERIVSKNGIKLVEYKPQVLRKKLRDSELIKRVKEYMSVLEDRHRTLINIQEREERVLTPYENQELKDLWEVKTKVDKPGYCFLIGKDEQQEKAVYDRFNVDSFYNRSDRVDPNSAKEYFRTFSRKKLENSLWESCNTDDIKTSCGSLKESRNHSLKDDDSLLADVCGKEENKQGCSGGIQGEFNKIITESDKETREDKIKSLEREIEVALEKAKNKKERCTEALERLKSKKLQGENHPCFDGFKIFFESIHEGSLGLNCSEAKINKYFDSVDIRQELFADFFDGIRKQYKMDELCLKRLEVIQRSLAEIKGDNTTDVDMDVAGRVSERQ